MKFIIRILAFTMVLSSFVEARNFYRTFFTFDAYYTHIRTGSKKLFDDKVKMVYSDDGEFCFFQFNNTETSCKISKFNGAAYPTVELPLDFIKSMFVIASEKGPNISNNEKEAVKRLMNYFPGSIQLSYDYISRTYQLHDNQPEAIHVTISPLDHGGPY